MYIVTYDITRTVSSDVHLLRNVNTRQRQLLEGGVILVLLRFV